MNSNLSANGHEMRVQVLVNYEINNYWNNVSYASTFGKIRKHFPLEPIPISDRLLE